MRTRKFVDCFLVSIFFAIISLPNIGLFYSTNKMQIKENLNRNAYEFPDINLKSLGTTNFSQIEQWYGDKILFINTFSKMWAFFLFQFQMSSKPEMVIIGKNNWLFLGNNHNDTLNQFTGKNRPSELEMKLMVDAFKNMNNVSKQFHIPFILIVAPDKHDIYSEYLPSYLGTRYTKTRLDLLNELLPKAGIHFIDLREAELTAKKFLGKKYGDIYFKGDSHWNYVGAYAAYEAMANYVDKNFDIKINKNTINFQMNETFDTDLTRFLHIKSISSNSPLPDLSNLKINYTMKNKVGIKNNIYPLKKFDNNNLNDGLHENINTYRLEGGNCLLIGDSFSDNLGFYFLNDFYNTVRVHHANNSYYLKDMIKKYKPKLIVFEIVERQLLNYSNKF